MFKMSNDQTVQEISNSLTISRNSNKQTVQEILNGLTTQHILEISNSRAVRNFEH